MKNETKESALEFLGILVNKPLCYGLKSPDTELYDFGFGELIKVIDRRNKEKVVANYSLHITCRFRIIKKKGDCRTNKCYYEDTPCDVFHSEIKNLVGLCVKRLALSEKNDLWLDFGDYWVVFATFEDGEESWRFFTTNTNEPHLVASDSWIGDDEDNTNNTGDGSE